MVAPSLGPAAVADQAKKVGLQDAWVVGTTQLVGVEGEELVAFAQEVKGHWQRAAEASVHPWCHWPEQQLEVKVVRWQTMCEACFAGYWDCLQPGLSLH